MVINREYTTKVNELDPSEQYACLVRDGVYIEVPKGAQDEEQLQLDLDNALLQAAINNFYVGLQCRDDVYCDKQIVRKDYCTGQPEAQPLIDKLQEAFPDRENWNRHVYNVVGEYTAYREPYKNNGISFYNFGEKPSEALLLEFGTSYMMTNLLDWYGLKFDLETEEIILKVVFSEYDGDTPELPYNPKNFFAHTHYKDGTMDDWVDYYAYATPKLIRNFCEEKGLSYPLPADIHKDCDVVWCWGFVFNRKTLEYGPVKAYARYNLPDEA